jgi:signal transduction histidine kinase
VNTPVTLAVDAAVATGLLAVAGLAYRDRAKPGALPFVALAVSLATMTVGVSVARSGVLVEPWRSFPIFTPFVFASVAWLALAFDYTGRGAVVTRRVAVGLGTFGVLVVGTTTLGTFVPDDVLPGWLVVVSVLQLAQIAAIVYGAVLVARSGVEYGDLSLGGSLLLAAVGSGLIVATIVQILVPPLAFDTMLVAMELLLGLITGLLLVVQVRYRVFATGASAGHLAREGVLDRMPAAVAITGRNDRVLDVNRTAERTFDVDEADDLGAPVEEAFGFDPDGAESRPLTVETSEGQRVVESERADLTGRGGDAVGRAYVLRDVTQQRTHQQRLDVLNRVLRHNLRNDLDAIRGFAEALERGDASLDDATLARQIRTTADEVADIGATLSTADRLLEGEQLDVEPTDVEAVLDDVADTVGAAFPAADITVASEGGSPTVRTDRRILAAALEEVVTNGVVHNDADTPHVELTARREDDGVVVAVGDDGPGIPERERAVLLEGEERPLRHGSGLGLWLVYWGVTRLGGELAFRERDPRGSTVTIRVPDR